MERTGCVRVKTGSLGRSLRVSRLKVVMNSVDASCVVGSRLSIKEVLADGRARIIGILCNGIQNIRFSTGLQVQFLEFHFKREDMDLGHSISFSYRQADFVPVECETHNTMKYQVGSEPVSLPVGNMFSDNCYVFKSDDDQPIIYKILSKESFSSELSACSYGVLKIEKFKATDQDPSTLDVDYSCSAYHDRQPQYTHAKQIRIVLRHFGWPVSSGAQLRFEVWTGEHPRDFTWFLVIVGISLAGLLVCIGIISGTIYVCERTSWARKCVQDDTDPNDALGLNSINRGRIPPPGRDDSPGLATVKEEEVEEDEEEDSEGEPLQKPAKANNVQPPNLKQQNFQIGAPLSLTSGAPMYTDDAMGHSSLPSYLMTSKKGHLRNSMIHEDDHYYYYDYLHDG